MRVRRRFGSRRYSCRRLVKTVTLVALDSPLAAEELPGIAVLAGAAAGRSEQVPSKPRAAHITSTSELTHPSKPATSKLPLSPKITVPAVQPAAPHAAVTSGLALLASNTLNSTSGSSERR
jgi:hypothetical protein